MQGMGSAILVDDFELRNFFPHGRSGLGGRLANKCRPAANGKSAKRKQPHTIHTNRELPDRDIQYDKPVLERLKSKPHEDQSDPERSHNPRR